MLVEAQGPWRAVEPGRVQVAEQGVHRRGPRARGAAHGLADPHHTAADVPPPRGISVIVDGFLWECGPGQARLTGPQQDPGPRRMAAPCL